MVKDKLRRLYTFSIISHIYRRVLPPLDPDPTKMVKEYDLYLAKDDPRNPPIFIVDKDGLVSPAKYEYALEPITGEDLESLILTLPYKIKLKVVKALASFGVELDVPKGNRKNKDFEWIEEKLLEKLSEIYLFYNAVPQLKDPSIIKEIDYKQLIQDIISFKVDKDDRLKAIHQSHLLRGLNQRINPHAITCTNAGTGKTTFYTMIGVNIGKALPNTLIGFAKSPDEVYPGTVNDVEVAINIDQIESQYAVQIVRFLFNVMESGEDRVDSGGVKFKVRCKAIFNFSANPIGYTKNPLKAFQTLMSHLSINPAFGRRLAIILYATDVRRITVKPKPEELEEWSDKIRLFRAIEEYARNKLIEIVHESRVWSWLNQPIKGYEDIINEVVADMEDSPVKELILEHAAGAHARIRGAALYSTLAENLDLIALNQYSIIDILDEAEEKLETYLNINIESFRNIASAWQTEFESMAAFYFNNLPDYLKEIISAIEWVRRKKQDLIRDNPSIPISYIPYQPEKYEYLSKAINKLNKLKRRDKLDKIEEYFKIKIIKNDRGEWIAEILDPNPAFYINPIGKLDESSPFSPFSQFHHFRRDAYSEEFDTNMSNEKERGTPQKRGNGENGENGERDRVILDGRPLRKRGKLDRMY